MKKSLHILYSLCLAAALGFGGVMGYHLVRTQLAAEIYEDRLATVVSDYEQLRGQYNEAVARSAVTELVVKDGALSVRVVAAGNVIEEIPTSFDPSKEIYIDYVVLDGRLWIRRVFDETTPPFAAVVIDPALASVHWTDPDETTPSLATTPTPAVGKAVYRALSDGRWVVTVTGSGSLGLARVGDADTVDLIRQPPVRDYDQLTRELHQALTGIGIRDVLTELTQ